MGICGAGMGLLVAAFWGLNWQAATILAVTLGMSSTAVSLKTFEDLQLSTSPGARFSLAVAIFQDLFIILFLLFLPLLLPASESDQPLLERLGRLLGSGLLFILLAAICARWVIPFVLGAVARSRNRELFTLTAIGCCVGLAFVGGILNLGLALGAFLAGLAVSESIYKHRILSDVMPLKDLFLTLFFVSVGLMVDVHMAQMYWKSILGLTCLLLLFKSACTTAIAKGMGMAPKQALLAGLSLCSAGEFSLILLQKAGSSGLWKAEVQQILISSVALSMGLVPAVMRWHGKLDAMFAKFGWWQVKVSRADEATLGVRVKNLEGHTIICGYGPVGQRLNKTLRDLGRTTLVIELNVTTVQNLKQSKQPVLFADVAHEETWALARLAFARMVVFTFPSAPVTLHAVEMIRRSRPDVPVLARGKFESDVERLRLLGITEAINDEVESGEAVVRRALILQGG